MLNNNVTRLRLFPKFYQFSFSAPLSLTVKRPFFMTSQVVTWISPGRYMDLSIYLYVFLPFASQNKAKVGPGILQVVTWICHGAYINLSIFLHAFLTLVTH